MDTWHVHWKWHASLVLPLRPLRRPKTDAITIWIGLLDFFHHTKLRRIGTISCIITIAPICWPMGNFATIGWDQIEINANLCIWPFPFCHDVRSLRPLPPHPLHSPQPPPQDRRDMQRCTGRIFSFGGEQLRTSHEDIVSRSPAICAALKQR